VRLPGDQTGLDGKIADTFNEIVAANARLAAELKRVGHVARGWGRGEKGDRARGLGRCFRSRPPRNWIIPDVLLPVGPCAIPARD
jgi:hypothetical protein